MLPNVPYCLLQFRYRDAAKRIGKTQCNGFEFVAGVLRCFNSYLIQLLFSRTKDFDFVGDTCCCVGKVSQSVGGSESWMSWNEGWVLLVQTF